MRSQDIRERDVDRGRKGHVLVSAPVLAILAAAGIAVLLSKDSSTRAGPTEVDRCETAANAGGESRPLLAIEKLRALDTSAGRSALKRLADSGNDRTAVKAISALGRSDFAGARDKLQSIYENPKRSDAARMAAQTAWCALQHKDGASWSDIKEYVKTHASGNARLEAQWAAVKGKFWSNEVDNG